MDAKTVSILKKALYYPSITFILLEVTLRILGFSPYEYRHYSIDASPENAFVGNKKLGIALNSGKYSITLNEGHTFSTTHNHLGRRLVTNSPHTVQNTALMLGCSYTYGYGVNDSEHFTSLVQNEFTSVQFKNLGVIGYGSVQSLIQLEQAFEEDTFEIVILNLSAYHLPRNNLSPSYRRDLKIGYDQSSKSTNNLMDDARFPYLGECNNEVMYVPWRDIYQNWIGRGYFASINAFQTTFDKILENTKHQTKITACLINRMNELCKEHNVVFGMACLNSSEQTKHIANRLEDINWLQVDFQFDNHAMINYPYDEHPNAAGHRYISKKMTPFINKLLEKTDINEQK